MTIDRRRIQGPELSVAPVIIKSSSDKKSNALVDENGNRLDGRDLEDIRKICMHFKISSISLTLTAEQAATKSNISIPASAKATEAHVIAAAKQDVVPSFSNTFINISIVDFGNNSSLTDGDNASKN
ncbi:7734_t:CDS:2, partial [Entrophospora sp. SA101]